MSAVDFQSAGCNNAVLTGLRAPPTPFPLHTHTHTNSFIFQLQTTAAKSGFFFFSLVTERLIFSRPKLPEVEAGEQSERLQGGRGEKNGAFEVAQTSLAGGRRPTAGRNAHVPP